MEEILASIRRIIADDEAKPPADKAAAPAAAAKPEKPAAAAPSGKPAAMNGIPPSAIPAAQAAAIKAAGAPAQPPAKPASAAAAPNNQDDIDALLSGLDEATSQSEIRPPQPEPEVFELTDEMALPDPPAAFQTVEPQEISNSPKPVPRKRSRGDWHTNRRPLRAPPRSSRCCPIRRYPRSNSAFNSLANTVLSNNARTLEDLVKEMLRPMLKSWLDDNLPGLVERIVKAEIERVSRGR